MADTTTRGAGIRARLGEGAVGPHLIDAEVGQAVPGLARRGLLGETAAERSMAAAERSMAAAELLVVDRYPHPPLRARAWELRDTVSYYDGLSVALAELLDVGLVTADDRLARAPGPRCRIERA